MSAEQLGIFRELEPPPGGLAAVHARLAAQRRRRLFWVPVLGTAATACAVLLVTIGLRSPRPAELPDDPTLQALGLAAGSSAEPVEVLPEARGRQAVLRVKTAPGVVYYRVSALTPAP